ncbi:DUF3368 domain-containing protein [[Phormidium] sp. ETS-05]|uniref:DUF3368 domain-containing protein n=1 Tax=[Phormidium] sp. ETS-05 TaxID=222819 RepID=UPI0018EF27D2|nr:DUF3368 domain-containing protein [[Phormidium] sp. ETS-05]
MIIVSNTSPITNLAAIKQLELLQKLYNRIVIPQAVYEELTNRGVQVPGATEVQIFPWIETQQVINQPLVQALRQKLDPGEAEAIALSIECNAEWLVIDERRGRKVASSMGLKYIGILGVILEAKNKGLVPKVKPLMDDLIAIAGFRISDPLYANILKAAGE